MIGLDSGHHELFFVSRAIFRTSHTDCTLVEKKTQTKNKYLPCQSNKSFPLNEN
jgi:hypothetical protein